MDEGNHWTSRRWLMAALAVYVLAVGVRLVWLSDARHNPLYQFPVIDERTHHEIGKAIANGTAPDKAYVRAPVYVYFLAGVYRVLGSESMHARWVQVFVSGLAPVLVLLISGRLFSPRVAVLAGALSAVFWTFVVFSTELLDVSLASVFYLLLLYLLIALDDRRWWKWLLCGAVLGLGAITRPNILAYPPFLAVALVWIGRKAAFQQTPRTEAAVWLKGVATKLAVLGIGAVLAIAPVTLRNILVSGEPILIAAWGPGVFWTVNNEHSDAKKLYRPAIDTLGSPILDELVKDPWFQYAELAQAMYIYAAEDLGGRPSYSQVGDFYNRLNRQYILDHPRKLFSDVIKRLCYTLNAYEYPFNKDLYAFAADSRLVSALRWLHFGVVCPVGIVGLLLAVGRRDWPKGQAYYVAMILGFVLPGSLFQITARYRLPITFLLMPVVAFGVFELIRLVGARQFSARRLAKPFGLLAALLVFCNANIPEFRPAHAEYLLPHFFHACIASEQHDRALDTADEVLRAIEDPDRRDYLPANITLPFFAYFYQRQEFQRATMFGRQMILRGDQATPRMLGAVLNVFVRLNRFEDAKLALVVIERATQGKLSLHLALASLRYGRAFGDRPALAKAVQLYQELVRRHPAEPRLRGDLRLATESLARLDNPSSLPTSTQSVR